MVGSRVTDDLRRLLLLLEWTGLLVHDYVFVLVVAVRRKLLLASLITLILIYLLLAVRGQLLVRFGFKNGLCMREVFGRLTTSEFRCLVSLWRHAQCVSLIYILGLVSDREINLVLGHTLLFSLVCSIIDPILPDVLVQNPVLDTVGAAHRLTD